MFIYVCSWFFAPYCTSIPGTGDAASGSGGTWCRDPQKSAGGEESFPDRAMVEGWKVEHIPLGTGQWHLGSITCTLLSGRAKVWPFYHGVWCHLCWLGTTLRQRLDDLEELLDDLTVPELCKIVFILAYLSQHHGRAKPI